MKQRLMGNAIVLGMLLPAACGQFGVAASFVHEGSMTSRTFSVTPLAGFAITGGIPNAAFLPPERQLVLIYTDHGLVEATSTDGVRFRDVGAVDQQLTRMLDGVGLTATDVIVRETSAGTRRYFAKGLPGPGSTEREIYAADRAADGTFNLLNGGAPVYSGGSADNKSVEVIDISDAGRGVWRMVYASPNSSSGNAHTAVSADEGESWEFESDNPFGDLGLTGADNVNVDPAILKLQDGTYIAVTMRGAKLFFFNSSDGARFTEVAGFVVDASVFANEAPGATGLFDPTVVQMPDGRIYLYAAAGDPTGGTIVAAEITLQ